MVEILSNEELLTLSLKDLKRHLKSLASAGYQFDYEDVKNQIKKKGNEEDATKYLRMKIRHIQRDKPKTSVSTEKSSNAKGSGSDRKSQLNSMTVRSKSKETDLMTIAQGLNVPNRTRLKKAELIEAILAAEKGQVSTKAINESKPAVKSKKSKPIVQESEESEESEESVPVVKSKKSKPIVEESEESVPVVKSKKSKPIVEESVPAPISIKPEPEDMCGKYTREQLLEKRIEELKTLLAKKGINADAVESKEKVVDLYCEMSSHGKSCDESNRYKCGPDQVCDISSNPGVCVSKDIAVDEPAWLEYRGRQIVGSKSAIKALQKKLNISKYEPVDPFSEEGFARGKLLSEAMRMTNRTKDDLSKFTDNQLRLIIEGYKIKSEKSHKSLLRQLSRESGESLDELSKLSVVELKRRAELMRGQLEAEKSSEKLNREELIEQVAALTDRNPSDFANWSNLALKQRMEAFLDGEALPRRKASPADSLSKKEKKRYKNELALKISNMTGKDPSFYDTWNISSLESKIAELQLADFEKYDKKVDKKQLRSEIASWTGSSPSTYSGWSTKELKQRLEALYDESESPLKTVSGIDSDDEVAPPLKIKSKKSAPVEDSSDDEDMPPLKIKSKKIIPAEDDSSDEEDMKQTEKEKKKARKKQESVSDKDVEKILAEVKSGKKSNIDEFTQVQNAVMKCLGLLSS
jgi:hypothetical protein